VSRDDLIPERLRRSGPVWCRAAEHTAVIAGAFCLVVAVLLAFNFEQRLASDPLDPAALGPLKAKLKDAVDDTSAIEALREKDRLIRHDYERLNKFAARGTVLLLGGLAVFLLALRFAAAFREDIPQPGEEPGQENVEMKMAACARWAIIVVVTSVTAAGLAATLLFSESAPVAVKPPADPMKQWAQFRGPWGTGVAAFINVPISWDGKSGKNILWKTPIPMRGQNSAIVWEDRVFCSGATESERKVFCFDADTGKLLWQRSVKDVVGTPEKPPEIMEMTGYAAPTMATDGMRAYAIFANGDLTAFDFSGRLVWSQNLVSSDEPTDNMYGHSSSLIVWKHMVIAQFDQGGDAEDGKSVLYAINGATGDVVWLAEERPVPNSWSSPIIIRHKGKPQLITAGAPWVIAYAPDTGEELWRAECLEGDIGPSPVYADGLVYACNEGADLVAIRPDGKGDVTKTHLVFKTGDYLPDTVSPVSDGRIVILVKGITVIAHDAKTGKRLWEKELGEHFNSSPTLVGERIYLMDEEGGMTIFRASRDAYREIGRASLGERSNTSPAFLDGRIYIRGKNHMFCIGSRDDQR
jgi:outer membrane protein assembly factor BamB